MGDCEHCVLTLESRAGWEKWERFLNSAVGTTVYHRERWLRSVGEGMGLDIRIHLATESGEIRAGAVLRRGGRPGLRSGHKPWATAYNGIVTEPRAETFHARFLCAALRSEYASVRLVQAPDHELRGGVANGWTLRSWPTLVLDVRDPERLWAAFDRRVRQRVRKARNLGVTAGPSSNADAFESLYRQTYERQGLRVNFAAGSVARTVAAATTGERIGLHVASTPKGEPAAALVVGEEGRQAYFMLAASHPLLRHTDAVSLLWWTAIEACAGRVDTVDLVGTGTSEIERFKQSFSPTLVDCVDASAQALRWRLAARLAGGARA